MYDPKTIRAILELMASDPFYFAKTIAPTYFTDDFAVFHRHMIRKINNLPDGKRIIVIEVPRGNGKTLIASTLNPLHRAIFASPKGKRIKYIVIASYSNTKAKQIIADYRNIIMSENFQGIFENTVLNKDREDLLEVENKDLGIKFQVMARGRESQVTGLRFEEARPEIFVADDLEDPDEAYNQDIVDRNVKFITEAVQFGLAPEGYSILIGTPFAFDCFTERFAKRTEGVAVIKYPQLVETQEMADELGLQIGQSIWEERFPTARMEKDMDEAFANGEIDIWLRQRQLNPVCDSQVRFNMKRIGRLESMGDIKGKKLNIYILSDYAYSKKIYADESAILVFGMDDQSNIYVLYSDKGKWGDIGTTEKIVKLVETYKKDLKLVGIEAHGMGYVEQRLMQIKRELNISFPVVKLEPQNRPKASRIKSMISRVDDGMVFFVGEHKKLEQELVMFRGTELNHGDDLSDTFGYIPDVAAKPETQKTREEREKELMHLDFERFRDEFRQSHEARYDPRRVTSVNRDNYY